MDRKRLKWWQGGLLGVLLLSCTLFAWRVCENHWRYDEMRDRYQRIQIGMTDTEVRAAVERVSVSEKELGTMWHQWWNYLVSESGSDDGSDEVALTQEAWRDGDVAIGVIYHNRRVYSKTFSVRVDEWRIIASNWFDQLCHLVGL
jgi:HAMP domain-containing protein